MREMLRRARMGMHMSCRQAAGQMGMSVLRLCMIEAGLNRPTVFEMDGFHELYGIAV